MKISLFSDYSLRVLMFAALKDGSFLVDEVTEAYGISRHHVAKVVNRLAQLGYLGTLRGRGGGNRLAQQPHEIRLGALLRKTEDQPVFVECFNAVTNTCPVAGSCRLKGILGQALGEFFASLDRYTLADLVTGPHREEMRKILLGAAPG